MDIHKIHLLDKRGGVMTCGLSSTYIDAVTGPVRFFISSHLMLNSERLDSVARAEREPSAYCEKCLSMAAMRVLEETAL